MRRIALFKLMGDQPQTIFPTVAGILIMVSGCLFIAYDLLMKRRSSLLLLELSNSSIPIAAGVLALIGGILCLRRTNLMMATIGAAFTLPLSLFAWPNFLSYIVIWPGGVMTSVAYSDLLVYTTTTVLSLLSLAFIAVSKSEFS